MNIELVPQKVSDIRLFGAATREHLDKDESNCDLQRFNTVGNIFADGKLAWLFNESSLEVVSTHNGWRHASCELGINTADLSVVITCVTELQHKTGWKLVVGTDCGLAGGLVCVFDVKTSKVIKAVKIPQKVAAVEIISNHGGVNPCNWMLPKELRYMHGIVAVSTLGGPVYLLDLQLDESFNLSDESRPGRLKLLNVERNDVANIRQDCLLHNQYLGLLLNDNGSVTSMLCIYKCGILALGFSSGVFQLWDLSTLVLVHSSVYEENSLGVVSFVFQEPENDPRKFCYLWVLHGHIDADYVPNDVTVALLYSLNFNKKLLLNHVGHVYQEFTSCMLRFYLPFSIEMSAMSNDDAVVGSRLVCCHSLDVIQAGHQQTEESSETIGINDDGGTSLCMFLWETFFKDVSLRSKMFLVIFDINRWYQAEMPSRLRYCSTGLCPFVGYFSMTEICRRSVPDGLLTLKIPSNGIFYPNSVSPSEKQCYPSFLKFDAVALNRTGVAHASYLGLQGQILFGMHHCGSSALLDPSSLYNMLVYANLIPLACEQNVIGVTMNGQREAILSVALEHGMTEFLVSCITDWASGCNVNECCNLRLFQEWAWKRVGFIKTFIDRQCTVLYDCSGLQLDSSVISCLYRRASQLKHLQSLFQALLEQSTITTDQGFRELQSKVNVISLLAIHLDVVLWFLYHNLLPENDEEVELRATRIAYPKKVLLQKYANLRAEAQNINSVIRPTDLLLIDGILENISDSISSLWEKEGGDGLYPPPSLHSLLNIYLLDDIPELIKHQIVQYVFLDLSTLFNDYVSAKLVKFPTAFWMTPSLIKLTRGFWLLDHKDFEEAIAVLLHPMINSMDIAPWQHRRIMKAFLYQGELKKALRYAKVRNPRNETPEDFKFHLSLLIVNGLITEAFSYQREICSLSNAEEILHHFFLGCQETRNLKMLLQLPFNTFEERCLESFLLKNQDVKCRELLVIHYVQLSRYIDAKRVNDQLKSNGKMESDSASVERCATRNAIVDGLYGLMPNVVQDMVLTCSNVATGVKVTEKASVPSLGNVKPLSTYVNSTSASSPFTRSTFLSKVMNEVSEMWNEPPNQYTPYKKYSNSIVCNSFIPFVTTPITSKVRTEECFSNRAFPSITSKSRDAVSNDKSIYQGSPSKKARYLDVNPVRFSGSAKRRGMTSYNAEALSMLQTPPVHRKTPSTRLTLNDSFVAPQSILKSHSSINPIFKHVQEKRTEAQIVDDTLAVTPDILDTSTVDLVKQLRFLSPNIDDDDASSTTSDKHKNTSVMVQLDSPLQAENVEKEINDNTKDDTESSIEVKVDTSSDEESIVAFSSLKSYASGTSEMAASRQNEGNESDSERLIGKKQQFLRELCVRSPTGMSPGHFIQKMLEIRTKMVEEVRKSGINPDDSSVPSLKHLVDNTVESSLASSPTSADSVFKISPELSPTVHIRKYHEFKESSRVTKNDVEAEDTIPAYQTRSASRMSTRSSLSASPVLGAVASEGKVLRSRTISTTTSPGSPGSEKTPTKSPKSFQNQNKKGVHQGDSPVDGIKSIETKPKRLGRKQGKSSHIASVCVLNEIPEVEQEPGGPGSCSFSFSQPTVLTDDRISKYDDLANVSSASTTSFIFSPPWTRSKSKRIRHTPDGEVSNESGSVLVSDSDSCLGTPKSVKANQPRLRKRQSSRLSTPSEFNDSAISFSLPASEGAGTPKRSLKGKPRLSTPHNMSLRRRHSTQQSQ